MLSKEFNNISIPVSIRQIVVYVCVVYTFVVVVYVITHIVYYLSMKNKPLSNKWLFASEETVFAKTCIFECLELYR